MKKLYMIAALVALYVIGCVEAKAEVACSTIANSDDRAYCRAVQTNSKGQCSAIQSYNLRQQCLVRLGARQTLCQTLSSPWAKEQCKDAARARR
jgi:hypothetical protein